MENNIFHECENHEEAERIIQKLWEAKMVIEGLEDVESGRVVDGERAIAEVRQKYRI